MSRTPESKRVEPVAKATEMVFEAELMQLRRSAARERQLRLSLDALERRASERFLESVDKAEGESLAYAEGQDRAWRDWISVRRGNLQAELATVLAEKSDRMAALAQSLGRKDIASRMHRSSLSEERRAALARDLANLQELAVLLNGGKKTPPLQ